MDGSRRGAVIRWRLEHLGHPVPVQALLCVGDPADELARRLESRGPEKVELAHQGGAPFLQQSRP